jgi:capsular exopolysaccharide synthesis family protein
VKSREELERRLAAPVLAAVPKVGGWRNRDEVQLIMKTDPKSPVSEAYRTLGTNIQYLASRQPLKVLMVTSSMGGDGKSTTSANLAVVLAQAGKRVILISADLRRPRLHQFFGFRNDLGLSSVLADGTSLALVAKDPGIANLRVVGGGPIPHDPAALLGSRRAAEFIRSIRDVSDFVIIDTPPVLAVADASILAPMVDGTIFVMNAERSSRSAMIQTRNQLENAGANLIGAVYNNFDPNQSAAYSHYYHNYYYQYYGVSDGATNGNGTTLKRLSRRLRGTGPERLPTGR